MRKPPRATALRALGLLLVSTVALAQPDAGPDRRVPVDVRSFQVISSESGSVDYYSVVESPDGAFIHAAYKPPLETTVLGFSVPEAYRPSVSRLRWRWRARVLPKGGNECAEGKGDSSAVVYVSWKSGLRWYTLKYVWSSVGPRGAVCDSKSNWFRVQRTVVVESGPPLDEWRAVELDLPSEFRKRFRDGDPSAEVPDFIGVAIMSDGDQTQSPSEADYGWFEYEVRR